MSSLGKILLWVALVGARVSLGAGWMLVSKKNDLSQNLVTEQQAKTQALADAKKQKELAQAAKTAEDAAEASLKDTQTKVADLTSKLDDATKKAADAQGAVDQANAAAAKAAADLKAITDQLKGGTVPDLIAARDKATADLASAQAEQKILTDQLQASQSQVEQLKKDINAKATGTQPPGISGKVTFVNRTWNFVVLDVGLNNGDVPNGQLIVYRKNTFLGKIKVTTADANSSVADILPDAKGDIQVGDYVLN